MNPQKHNMSVLAQISSWIPDRIIENLAKSNASVIDIEAKTYVVGYLRWSLQ